MLRHAQLGKEFPRCRAVALYISMKKGGVKNFPNRKIAQIVKSERFFGMMNYATK